MTATAGTGGPGALPPTNPPLQADERRLAACFRGVGISGLLGELRSEPRFAARLERLLEAKFTLDPDDAAVLDALPPADRSLLKLEREALQACAFRAAMALWSGTFAREVRRPVVVALMDRFGEDAFREALANREFAVSRSAPDDLDEWHSCVEKDARTCLAAWLSSLPPPALRRARLKWPDDAALPQIGDAALAAPGCAVLRRLASRDAGDAG